MEGEKERAGETGSAVERPSEGARWTAAVGYLAFICLFLLGRAKRDRFVRFHVSQGVVLFLAECLSMALVLALALTLGKVKLVGLVTVALVELVAVLAAVVLSVGGMATALRGEYWSMPFLGQYRERLLGLEEKGA